MLIKTQGVENAALPLSEPEESLAQNNFADQESSAAEAEHSQNWARVL